MKVRLSNLMKSEEAVRLRKEGHSYSAISSNLNITKSTLSDWLKHIPYTPNSETIARTRNGPKKSALKRKNFRIKNTLAIYNSAVRDIGEVSDRDLLMFGLGLYMGEGAKSIESVRIINSNPDVINLGINWLKREYSVKTENLRLSIHTYPDIDRNVAIEYWSRTTGIPKTQFGKIQIDNRLNKSVRAINKLPFGTVQLRVVAGGNRNLGVSLHRRILASIEAVIIRVNKRD